jgi:hypothetical protein
MSSLSTNTPSPSQGNAPHTSAKPSASEPSADGSASPAPRKGCRGWHRSRIAVLAETAILTDDRGALGWFGGILGPLGGTIPPNIPRHAYRRVRLRGRCTHALGALLHTHTEGTRVPSVDPRAPGVDHARSPFGYVSTLHRHCPASA